MCLAHIDTLTLLILKKHGNILFPGSKIVSDTTFLFDRTWIDHCAAKWARDKSSDYSLMFVHKGSVCLGS